MRAGLNSGLGAVPAVVFSLIGRIGTFVTIPTAYHQIVAEGKCTIVVAAGARADAPEAGCTQRSGFGHHDAAVDGDIGSRPVLAATDTGAIIRTALGIDIAAVDGYDTTVASFAAANAGRIRAAIGLHAAAVDDEGSPSFAIAATDTGAISVSVRLDITAVDGDGPRTVVSSNLSTADSGRIIIPSGCNGSSPNGQITV